MIHEYMMEFILYDPLDFPSPASDDRGSGRMKLEDLPKRLVILPRALLGRFATGAT